MRKVRVLLAAALVAVFVLGALNVSVAGQRDRLRQKVRLLTERMATLQVTTEALQATTEKALIKLEARTQHLNDFGFYRSYIYNRQILSSECPEEAPALWKPGPFGDQALSC